MGIMWLIWKIIKFLLIALLFILVLVIALIIIALVAPIQYEAYVSRYEEVDYDIKIRYLIGIKALFKQENDKKNHMITVFGKTIYKNKVVEEEGSKEEGTPDLDDGADDQPSENTNQRVASETQQGSPETHSETVQPETQQESPETHSETVQPATQQESPETHSETVQPATQQESIETHSEPEKVVDYKKRQPSKENHFEETVEEDGQDLKVVKEVNPELKQEAKEGIKEVAEEIKEETVETIEKMPFPWLKRFLLDKTTYRSIKLIVKYTWYILKYIAPYEWSYELVVGRDNPADTGELVAYLMAFYPLYGDKGIIRGNFEEACLEGGFLARGKFKIGGILIYVLRCVLSEPVRTMIRLVLKLRKEEQQDGK